MEKLSVFVSEEFVCCNKNVATVFVWRDCLPVLEHFFSVVQASNPFLAKSVSQLEMDFAEKAVRLLDGEEVAYARKFPAIESAEALEADLFLFLADAVKDSSR